MTFKLWSIGSSMQQPADAAVWRLLAFDDLRVAELYEVLRLRSEVFVVEQQCLFHDMDGADQHAMHLLGVKEGQLQAYARCMPAGAKFAEASFGRVVTRPGVRRTGLGHALIEQSISAISQLWGPQPIRIAAQMQLAGFYAKHGFVDVQHHFMEDGIAHLEMLRAA